MTETLALTSIIVLVVLGCGFGLFVTLAPMIMFWRDEKTKKKRAKPT